MAEGYAAGKPPPLTELLKKYSELGAIPTLQVLKTNTSLKSSATTQLLKLLITVRYEIVEH